MQPLDGFIVDVFQGGVVVGLLPRRKLRFRTNKKFKLGQKVEVLYDYTTETIASIRIPGEEPTAGETSLNFSPQPPPDDPDEVIIDDEEEILRPGVFGYGIYNNED